MKQFFAFLRKEFLQISRDKVTMLILMVMPVVLIALFGYAIVTEVKSNRIVVVDRQKNHQSAEIIKALKANRYSSVVDVVDDQRGTTELLQNGDADAILILDKTHGAQIIADGSEPNQAQTRVSYIQQIVSPLAPKGRMSNIATPQTSNSIKNSPFFASSGAERNGGGGAVSHMLFNPQLKSEYNFVPGVIGMIIMLICALMTSISIVREKETGTMEVLLASPLHPLTIILSKLVPFFLVSTVNLVTILLLARFALGIPIAGSIPVFFLVSMVYIFVALALGLLISCAVGSQLAAMLLSLLLIVPTVYLSGLAFPITSMAKFLQYITYIIPATWYIDAARKLLIQGVEFQYVLKDLVILCIMAAVFIAISLKLFKIRLE